MMRESLIEKYLTAQVRKRGGWSVKLAPTRAGLPDRLVLLPGGRMRLVELKQPAGKVSRIQEVVHGKLYELGFPVAVLWSVPQVTAWLDQQDQEIR